MSAKVARLIPLGLLLLLAFTSLKAEETDHVEQTPSRIIAPLFKKGPGYATFGAMSFGQPPFLTAGDANAVINRELISAGLVFLRSTERISGNDISFVLDGYDRKHNIGFKFLSLEDYTEFANIYNEKRKKSPYRMEQDTYILDFRLMSTELLKAAEEQQKMNFVVFYDPCGDTTYDSKLWLAEQVMAFVKWAAKNKLIETPAVENQLE